jgi:hypothetical protein
MSPYQTTRNLLTPVFLTHPIDTLRGCMEDRRMIKKGLFPTALYNTDCTQSILTGLIDDSVALRLKPWQNHIATPPAKK